MSKLSRRQFAGGLLAGSTALAMPSLAFGATPRVVVVGGGAGGATAARYIAKDSKGAVNVTLDRGVEALLHLLLLQPVSWRLPKLWLHWP